MRTWAAGSKAGPARRRARGFTLLELLVVVAIIALGSAGVVLALRDDGTTRLDREAQRLAALLDSARALSRAGGTPVRWVANDQGFRFEGLPPRALPTTWLDPQTQPSAGAALLLGPEPIIGPQAVVLRLRDQAGVARQVATDGLGPFQVRALAAPAAP